MKSLLTSILLSLLFATSNSFAQDHGHHMNHGDDKVQTDTMNHEGNMSHAFSRNLPMARNGSGTGWLPDSSPMHGYMFHSDEWVFMLHGNIFLTYNNQDIGNKGNRDDELFYAPNWLMGMGQTNVGDRGLFRFSAMLSLDPLTVGGAGYPLLFQSGETWNGEPLVDHQHPHDLFSELSVSYTQMLSEDSDVFAYIGFPGEPAFGPVAFMHRPSSLYNPNAPIGHHWQDATHILFGVSTLGYRYKDMKIEGSLFTGTEPNENRYDFDEPRFNSWSLRLSYNPTPAWALQVSQAWIKDAHAMGPPEDVNKTTASAIHSINWGNQNSLNTTAVWGFNNTVDGHHADSHSFLLESALGLNNTAIYGKYEWVEKSSGDLLLDEAIFGHGNLYPVNTFTLGVQQKLANTLNTDIALGVQSTLYITPDQLEQEYGKNPVGVQVYLRLSPSNMMSK